MRPDASSGKREPAALALAAGLHALCCALGLWLAPVRESQSQELVTPDTTAELLWLEGEALPSGAPQPTAASTSAATQPEATAQPETATQPEAPAQSAAPAQPEAPAQPSPAPEAPAVPGSQREASPKLAIAPRSSVPSPKETLPPPLAEPGAEEGGGASFKPPQPHQPPEPPHEALSLQQLGVGEDNPFWNQGPEHPGKPTGKQGEAQAAQRRLTHVLQQAMVEADQKRGLGPEGPALVAAEEVVQVSTVPPISEATLLLRTDASGKVVYAELLRVDDAADEWERVKKDLLERLASVRLRVPASSGGVSMKVKISSDNQLPSGAHPGLAVSVLGIPIKKGEGPRSTSIGILSPKMIVTPPSAAERDGILPQIQISAPLFGFYGDPVDIGAPARRVVHAKLLDLQVHPPSR